MIVSGVDLGPYDVPVFVQFPAGALGIRLRWEFQSPLLPPILREAFVFYARRRFEKYHQATLVEAIGRTNPERDSLSSSKIHTDYRGIDSRVFKDDQGVPMSWEEEIRLEVVKRFPTGIQGMPRIEPLVHGTGPHGHTQATIAEADEWIRRAGLWNGKRREKSTAHSATS